MSHYHTLSHISQLARVANVYSLEIQLGHYHGVARVSREYHVTRKLRIWLDGQSCTSQPHNRPLQVS